MSYARAAAPKSAPRIRALIGCAALTMLGAGVAPPGGSLYVTDARHSKLMVVDTAATTVTTSVSVGPNPLGVALNPAGTFAYVANYGNDTVSVVDTNTNAVVATVPVGGGPDGIAINAAGSYVYV